MKVVNQDFQEESEELLYECTQSGMNTIGGRCFKGVLMSKNGQLNSGIMKELNTKWKNTKMQKRKKKKKTP